MNLYIIGYVIITIWSSYLFPYKCIKIVLQFPCPSQTRLFSVFSMALSSKYHISINFALKQNRMINIRKGYLINPALLRRSRCLARDAACTRSLVGCVH